MTELSYRVGEFTTKIYAEALAASAKLKKPITSVYTPVRKFEGTTAREKAERRKANAV